jgi:Tol biopolymer transport system component
MRSLPLALLFASIASIPQANAQTLGAFTDQVDIGVNPMPGKAEFDAAAGSYSVTGGGANIWGAEDAFHFVWKRVSGNVTMTADLQWIGAGKVAHRKAALMIRQSLDPGSAYADVAWHGDGLTSLQYRTAAGAATLEERSTVKAPTRVRIVRQNDQFTIYVPDASGAMQPSGPVTVEMKDPVYIGLAVCSHDANDLQTAVFSKVAIDVKPREKITSVVSIFDLRTNTAQVLTRIPHRVEAPNWSPDGTYLMVNGGGDLFRLSLAKPALERIALESSELGAVRNINNDHGITLDGKTIALSARGPAGGSQVYLAGADGANPRLMTPEAPSYFHGFSPDGKFLAFVSQRDKNFDLYRMPVAGGAEERLTSNPGYDDGPDYSPDGKWIYFNSDRSGSWDIWRMPADGAGPDDQRAERVTSDEWEDWFPHPSPDGKWIVFLSFPKGTEGHPPNRHVMIRRIPMPGDTLSAVQPEVLMQFLGGQGTMNVNSWSPDSRKFAFVRYETPE